MGVKIKRESVRWLVPIIVIAALGSGGASAQVAIPAGSTIDQAVVSIFADTFTGEVVNLHRITADWGENTVSWNSFNGSYDPVVEGTFNSTFGWNPVDVTHLVQEWVDGTAVNYGILLAELGGFYSRYYSSEYEFPDQRPKLEIWYTDPAGAAGYAVIQRPGDAQDGVKDAYIWELDPTSNGWYKERLFTGIFNDYEKQTLVQFLFDVPAVGPGTGTPGYWKNHPDAWPVAVIDIGGVIYSREQAIGIMKRPVRKDMTIAMFKALVAAKLNVLIGNDDSCIWQEIQDADAWLAMYPVGSGVGAGGDTSPWRDGEPIHDLLDDYNKGLLPCADPR